MINVSLNPDGNKPLHVLCMGCHSDDIEIGCGGTILRLIQDYLSVRFHWVVFSAIGPRKAEAERGAHLFAGADRLEQLVLKEFPDGFMPWVGSEVKATFEEAQAKG